MVNVHSLPFKINAAIITTAIILSVSFLLILYPLELRRAEEQLERIHLLLDTVFQQKLNDLANELFAKQERALLATLKEIETTNDIIGIDIYDTTGELFLSSNLVLHSRMSETGALPEKRGDRFTAVKSADGILGVYTNTIEVIGRKIGFITMYYDLDAIKAESRRAITILFTLPIVILLLMAVLLNFFLFRSIIKPVTTLRNAMRNVERGNLGETVSLPKKDEIGEMGVAFNDMSEKLRSGHQALQEAEAKYRSIFENAIEGIFQYSVKHRRFITVNPSMARILGYESPLDLLTRNKDIEETFFPHPESWHAFRTAMEGSGRVLGLETEIRDRDGNELWVSVSARRVFDEDGLPLYDEGSFVDITEHRQRMAAEQQREAAESANRAKSDFLAKMSHEIRTPLNAILGFADILESELTDEKYKSYCQIIQSSGTNLLSLINDILDLSRIEAGKLDLQFAAVDIRTLIEELVRLFTVIAGQKEVEVSSQVEESVPRHLVTDGPRLRQILFNLIGNGVKFTEKGSVRIYCSAERTAAKNWNLFFVVADTGPGINDSALDHVFESFRQGGVNNQHMEGSGLGLAITKHLVEMMNGTIGVKSEPEHGTIFTVSLFDLQSTAEDEEYAAPAEKHDAGTLLFKPARLLVVDDLEVNREHIRSSLADHPFSIVEADNGNSAVAAVEEEPPDLILMDIFMPESDGYEAISRIRKRREMPLPIIAITAAGMREDVEKIMHSGFDDYLIRPFNKHQLLAKLTRFLPHTVIDHPEQEQFQSRQSQNRDIYRSPWRCPPELADMLEGQFRQRWRSISNRQRLPDIIEFAGDLQDLGRRYSSEVLTVLGTEIFTHAENVDIDRLQSCLGEYPAVLAHLRRDQ